MQTTFNQFIPSSLRVTYRKQVGPVEKLAWAHAGGRAMQEAKAERVREYTDKNTLHWKHDTQYFKPIGIGAVSTADRSPATPPGMRVRTGRFEKLRS